MSRYGISISPTMMKLGSTTPAYQGSKNTSISCNPRKYHGAFDGLGVLVVLAGSSSGASIVIDQMVSKTTTAIAIRNSTRTRNGQQCTLSSMGAAVFFAATCLPAGGEALAAGTL